MSSLNNDLSIPAFLLVANREPLDEAAKARVKRFLAQRPGQGVDTPRWYKGARSQLPKTMTPEAWALLKQITEERAARQRERLAALKASKG
jgi:hypothetical protein